jgi:hypothetical protein
MIKCSASRRMPLQQLLQLWQRLLQQPTLAVVRISNRSTPWQLRRSLQPRQQRRQLLPLQMVLSIGWRALPAATTADSSRSSSRTAASRAAYQQCIVRWPACFCQQLL